jgi:hypothetical protein
VKFVEFEWGRCIDGYRFNEDGSDVSRVSDRFEKYSPSQIDVLFQTFLDTPATGEGVLNFVSKFGPLGGSGRTFYLNEPVDYMFNEPVASFLERQEALRQASELADAADWIGLVDCYNDIQNTGIHGQLLAGRPGRLRSQLRHQPHGKVALVFVPTNLIQLLWLQFAWRLSSGNKLLRCERCSAPFIVGAGTGRRETAKFCSNACKVAAFRARNEGKTVHA